MPTRLVRALVGVLAAALLAPAAAAQAAPAPFGHPCRVAQGVRVCPTTTLASRVRSWDGTPLDVDVTLPRRGAGPFPTIALLHGLGGTKSSYDGGDPRYNRAFFARRGYAVVTPTARGFGRSCGTPASRTPDCRRGWVRLNDMRYEIRDVQHLLGLLVDERVARRDAVGVTGISYGGGASTMLAWLRNRIRRPDGSFAAWRTPRGTRLSLAAAWPRWQWTNGETIFIRNGRGAWSRSPVGVKTPAYGAAIFAIPFTGFVAPLGSELSADVRLWKAQLDAGVLTGPRLRRILDLAFRFHGVAAVPGVPAPVLLQSGWTDALFPATQALAGYAAVLRRHPRAPIALQLADLGHNPGANHPGDVAAFDRQGLAFLDHWLRGRGRPLPSGRVTAYTMTCPKTARNGGGPYVADHLARLAPRRFAFGTRRRLSIDQRGASRRLAAALNPLFVDLCALRRPDRTSRAVFSTRSPGITLLGPPILTGHVGTTGRNGQLAARVWDLDPGTGRQRLITRGAYRLRDFQRGAFRFELDGNGWRFARGHRIVVELLGRDAPTYGPSPTPFRATLSDLRITLPDP